MAMGHSRPPMTVYTVLSLRKLSVLSCRSFDDLESQVGFTAVRLQVEENQLVAVFDEIGVPIDGLKAA
jgi:hypothetical protein